MKFREILRELDRVGSTTSKDLAHRLNKPVKEISNDLGRLRQMGFARADYGMRVCKLGQWGDVCNRGYQYSFYVSEQGRSYLNWMDRIKPREDFERKIVMNRIAACLPSDLKIQLLAYYLSKPQNRYNRQSRRSGFLADLVSTASVLSGEPAPLEVENRRLAEENQKLSTELARLLTSTTQMSRDYEDKIKEADRKCIKQEEELDAEMERMRTKIDISMRVQRYHERVNRELLGLHLDQRNILLRVIRKSAPRKEYAEFVESVCNYERSSLNSINMNALCDALFGSVDNSQESTPL